MTGTFLAERRKALKLSQKVVAEKLQYTTQIVSVWETGNGYPMLSIWSKYASILELDLEGFLFDKVQKNNDYCDTKNFDVEKFSKNKLQ